MGRIKDPEAHWTRDTAYLADIHLDVRPCPGGRAIAGGYICPHCGADPTYGDCKGVRGFKKIKV